MKMKIIEYNTEEEALARSKVEAYKNGCDATTTTQYWWAVQEGTNSKWGLRVGDTEVAEDTIEVSEEWFKQEEIEE